MNFNFYIVFYSIVAISFVAIMIMLAFSRYRHKVLNKSYIDTKLYIYIVMLSAIFYVGSIYYTYSLASMSNLTYLIFALIFLAFCVSVMLMLFVSLRPVKRIDDMAKQIALGKKNLNVDFEGALEFESISKSLENIQKVYRDNDRKLNKKDTIYQKFIPKEYLKYFGKTKFEELEVGDNVQVKLCTLFCDLRNSYFSSETLSLSGNFDIINEFLMLVSKVISENNGFVDKFVGDGVIAIFDNEDDALNSANLIAKQLDYKNLVAVGKEPIKYGISLNSGMCVVGVVGSKRQMQFSVVSDVVNLCSRIEGLNKIFGTRVLMTKNFMSNLKNGYVTRYVGTIEFDDLTSKVPVFESLDAYSDSKKTALAKYLTEFESGVRFFEKGEYEKAKQFFGFCIKKDTDNYLAKYYFQNAVGQMSKLLSHNQNN